MSPSHDLFDQLYHEHHVMVYRLALGLTGNSHDAEEIVQEAFLRALRSYGDFRGEAELSTWVCRIAINVAQDYLRQRKKFPVPSLIEDHGFNLDEILDPDPAHDPETEIFAHQVRLRCLHSLTECFPLEQRKVFCLAITLGLPHKVVAEILESSVAAVKTALHRAKAKWFDYMEDRCQLINKAGSCSCGGWVRFGRSQGWFTAKSAGAPVSPDPMQTVEEIGRLKTLRALYQGCSEETADELYVERMRDGIRNREWSLLSS